MNNFLYKILFIINFKKKILPIILKDYFSKKILTLVWCNKINIIETFFFKKPCYWSRSKKLFWRKGYYSNNIQILIKIKFDCDLDTFLFLISSFKNNCHYNLFSCFNYNL